MPNEDNIVSKEVSNSLDKELFYDLLMEQQEQM